MLFAHIAASHSATLWLCGGGTGGHVYPGLAVAAALAGAGRGSKAAVPASAKPPNIQLGYIGSQEGMEAGLVAQESNVPFYAIPAAALRGRGPITLARNAATLARGTLAARRLIARHRPDAILGTGGYVCVPLFLAARAAKVPTAIYLPDVVPGLAVRLLARIATAVVSSVEDSAAFFGRQAVDLRMWSASAALNNQRSALLVSGYPVRPELFEQDRAACRAAFRLRDDLPAVLVYGGSRGARSINQAILALIRHILPIAQIIHVCGREGDETWLRDGTQQLPEELRTRYHLYPYLHSGTPEKAVAQGGTPDNAPMPAKTMIAALAAADIAVCRSGASTLGELPAVGLPAVLVPYPYVHQEENADYLVRHRAAFKVKDGEMLGDRQPEEGQLFQYLKHLIANPRERTTMSERSRALARPDAPDHLADVLSALAARRSLT